EGRLRELTPEHLIAWGLAAPPTHAPGAGWAYSNTNYILLGQLLEKMTGMRAETYIDRHIIKPAGMENTYFPATPYVQGPHSRQYESLHGGADPPREYSVYDMSWIGTAGALVSTMDDLNRFYRALFTGKLIGTGTLVEMRRTVPVRDEDGNPIMNYGLGLYAVTMPCGTFWGHDGIVFGAGTQALSSPDGRKQIALGHNLTKYQELNGNGAPVPHAIDNAMGAHMVQALCGGGGPLPNPTVRQTPPLPLQYLARH
ncbi:serine hydrolase domain-containing protein, partial [Actinomadura adrarensis]